MNKYELFTKSTQAFFYNLKQVPIQRMLDFDFISKRKIPSIAAIIHPGRKGFHKTFFGNKEILIPIYSTIEDAVDKHKHVDNLINFASFRSAYDSTKKALGQESINTITIVAEGIPERESKELFAIAKEKGKMIIGPATVGALVAGTFRIGHAGGDLDNIIESKLYRPGSVGLVSKSGGMMNEFFNIIARATTGIYEGVAIGGDAYPGSTLLDHILRYEKNPKISMVVALGEVGGEMEYEIIEAKKLGKITKPIVMWVSGTCSDIFPWQVQFGHAGAKVSSDRDTAQAKNQKLREAGIIVPNSFEEFESTIAQTFKKMEDNSINSVNSEQKLQELNMSKQKLPDEISIDLQSINKRTSTSVVSTICDERGEEPLYSGISLSELVKKNKGLGSIIGLLWFKKELPTFFTEFLELSMILTADHGPAVSGAHNAIVAARAGKDIISSLASGLLTIGPRFGGATDAACRYFKEAHGKKQDAYSFVQSMKEKGIRIPGIGHRIKSKQNPDKRVEILIEFARKNIPSQTYLNYALEVEKTTLQKADSLILNVDGCLAALFLDVLHSSNQLSAEEISQIIYIGYMNGLFALARSIGIIGHVLDQKRLGEGLYRHDTNDILYVKETNNL